MDFASNLSLIVMAIIVLGAIGSLATRLLYKRNRDLLIVVYSVIVIGAVLIAFELLVLTLPRNSINSSSKASELAGRTVKMNLPIPCGDCEQDKISVALKSVTINPREQTMTFSFQFTNGTDHSWGLTFSSLKLTDPNGNDYLGQGDPFFVNAEQSAIENATFPLFPQHGVTYTLKMVVLRPDQFQNYYQTLPLTF